MGANADTMKAGYDAFARGDMDAVMAVWNDDIVWEGPNAEELPGGGTHRGKKAVAAMLGRIADNWDDFDAPADEYHEDGETVVVLGHLDARAKSTGTEVKAPYVQVWRMRDGKASRVLTLTDTAVLLTALTG